MTAELEQIARVNPKINAIVAKLDDAKCLALADDADRRLARGEQVGPLHGIPWAFKDLRSRRRVSRTQGSPIFKNFMPTEDSTLVARLRAAGVIPIGKTNVPELGMGSHSYNKVYGTTLNPWISPRPPADRPAEAAAALAAGLLSFADGSDLGGSLQESRELQQHHRDPPDGRTGADHADAAAVPRVQRQGAARTISGGRRVCAERDGRARCTRSSVLSVRSIDLREAARPRCARRARRMVPRPRRAAARQARACGARVAAEDIRGSRLHRGRGMSRSHGGRRDISYASQVEVVGLVRAAARRRTATSSSPKPSGRSRRARELTSADVAHAMVRHGVLWTACAASRRNTSSLCAP